MINHIVKSGETLDEIMFKYNMTKEELYNLNPQLSSTQNLKTGMVLRIKAVTRNDYQIINNLEPFMEKYYEIVEGFDYSEDDNKEEENKKEEIEFDYRYINPYYMYYPFYYKS